MFKLLLLLLPIIFQHFNFSIIMNVKPHIENAATTPIVLLHGAGGHPWTMASIQGVLWSKGYKNVHNVSYDYNGTLEESVADTHRTLTQLFPERRPKIVFIGQSLGGVVAIVRVELLLIQHQQQKPES